jgi:ABC-type Co2+ transport system permease subunit
MHIPDGFIDIPTSAAFAAISAVGVGACLKGATRSLDEKTAPLAGLTATFIFAVQMLNFPVAAGTSGHLLGGVLAAVLVGPYVATLAITVVSTFASAFICRWWADSSRTKHIQLISTWSVGRICNLLSYQESHAEE